jgi:hypothetical protein
VTGVSRERCARVPGRASRGADSSRRCQDALVGQHVLLHRCARQPGAHHQGGNGWKRRLSFEDPLPGCLPPTAARPWVHDSDTKDLKNAPCCPARQQQPSSPASQGTRQPQRHSLKAVTEPRRQLVRQRHLHSAQPARVMTPSVLLRLLALARFAAELGTASAEEQPPSRPDCTWQPDTDYDPTSSSGTVAVATKEECCAACFSHPTCRAGTFQENTGQGKPSEW